MRLFILLFTLISQPGWALEPIRVGILHSLTGTMAQSETPLKNVALMTIDQINAQGGVLGRPLEGVVVDPGSDWDRYTELADELLSKEGIDVLFGCWTSVSRKATIPALERNGGLLFYPVQYEGEERHPQIFYMGAAPNQQAIPAAEYLLRPSGGSFTQFALLGTDYIYPRTSNTILRNFLLSRGIHPDDIIEIYTPFGHADFSAELSQIRDFAGQNPHVAIISTVNGDANNALYSSFQNAVMSAENFPIIAFSVGETELQSVEPQAAAGHLASWNYFMSLKSKSNIAFIDQYRSWLSSNMPHIDAKTAVVNDPMEATYIGIHLWRQAVELAGTTDPLSVEEQMGNLRFQAPSGYEIRVDPKNHHLYKPVFLGRANTSGQFDIIWRSPSPLKASAFSSYMRP